MRLLISKCDVFIDDEDYPLVSRFSWYVKKGGRKTDLPYVCCEVWHNRKKIKLSLHRLIMGMGMNEVDHVNGNPLDNRKINLRYCTTSQQQYNRKRRNKTGYKGVASWASADRFFARVRIDGKEHREGPFKTAKEAAIAYNIMARRIFGPFARLNEIKE